MTKYKRNNKIHKSKKDQLTYLDLLQNNYPYNSYDGWTMPTQQMQFNSGSFWQNPTLGQNLSQNTTLGLGQNSMYNLGQNNTPKLSMSSSSSSGKGLIGNSSLAPVYGAAAGMGFDTVDNLLAGGKKTGLGTGAVNAGATLMTAGLSSGNPALMLAGGIAGTAGTLYNAAFGSKLNKERIAQAENEINAANSFNANASNFDDLSQQILSSPVITGFTQKDIGSDGWFSNKAKNKYRDLLAQKEYAENWVDRSIANTATNLQQQQMNNLLQNYAAYGGLLDMNNQYSDGGKIYIKPENRGKFTALKERTGKSATWFKEHGTPAQKKMATFALNSRKWKHDDGGSLNPYSAESLVNAIYDSSVGEEFLGKPSHNYDFTQSEEWADNHGYYPDSRGHRDDRVKKPAHPTHPSRGNWTGNVFNLTDKGVRDPNYILFGMNDGDQDPQAIMSYKGGIVLPEITVTPESSYINNSYDNTHIIMKRKKAFGGDLLTHGAEWDNGVTVIGNGGTHEESPYEGVQMGVDNQGIPNLVEQDEVIYNDYVFSNRIPVPNAVRNKYKLRGTKDMTFADAAKKVAKESEERPNDPISQRGLEDIMNKLANEQEIMREQKRTGNKYKKGGKLNNLLDAYNDWVTNPYNTATTGFGEGLDVSPSQAAQREKTIRNTTDYNQQTDDLIDRDNLLRYAPVFGSALGVGYGLLSKPNYSRADALAQFAENAGKITPITYEPIGNYLTYRPTDLSYQANRMAAQAGATRRNIMNTSGGNRANAIGSLLAADYNSQIAMGEAIRQAEATNFARRAQVEEFNRATNQFNAEAALKAAIANQQARLDASKLGLSGYTTAMQMKDAIDAQRAKTLSANLTNLFESLGQIGEEQLDRNRLKWLERKGILRSDYFDTDKYSKNNKKTKG